MCVDVAVFKEPGMEGEAGVQAGPEGGAVPAETCDTSAQAVQPMGDHGQQTEVPQPTETCDTSAQAVQPTGEHGQQTEVPKSAETCDTSAQAVQPTGEHGQQTEVPKSAETCDMSAQAVQPTGEHGQQTEVKPGETRSCQTPAPATTSETASQAVRPTLEHQMQTDVKPEKTCSSQTDVPPSHERMCQTPRPATREQQTVTAPLVHATMQTDPEPVPVVRTVPTQTIIKKWAEGAAQTDNPVLCDSHQQTTIRHYKDSGLQVAAHVMERPQQTDIKTYVDGLVQTDPKPLATKQVQASTAMRHVDMQTVYMGVEKAVQQSVTMCSMEQQTIIKHYKELSVQAAVTQESRQMQTCRDYYQQAECQTDDVIVLDPEEQCENDCQTDALIMVQPEDQREIEVQTDEVKVIYPSTMVPSEMQTDFMRVIDPQLEAELCVQTDEVHIRDPEAQVEISVETEAVEVREPVERVETEVQTRMVWVTGLHQAEEPQEEQQVEQQVQAEQQAPQQEDPDGPPRLEPPPALEPPPPEGQLEGLPQLEPEGLIRQDMRSGFTVIEEKYVQTDPVTIIIGDSSFLVDRLKDYAGGPSPSGRGRGRGRARGRGRGMRFKRDDGPPTLIPEEGVIYDETTGPREMPVLNAEEIQRRPRGRGGRPRGIKRENMGEGSNYTSLRPKPLEPKDLVPDNVKGKFNCPYCPLTFGDSVALYKHLQTHHNLPRAINRRTRRKGTIIVTEDGQRIVENGGPPKPARSPRKRRQSQFLKMEPDVEEEEEEEEPLPPPVPTSSQSYTLGQPLVEQLVEETLGDNLEEGEEIEVLIEFAQDEGAEGTEGEGAQQQLPAIEAAETYTFPPNTQPATVQALQQESVAVASIQNGEEVPVIEPPVGKRAFSCPFCPKTFPKSSALYVHLQNTHKSERSQTRGTPRTANKSLIRTTAATVSEQQYVEVPVGNVTETVTEQDFLAGPVIEEEATDEVLAEEQQVVEVVVADSFETVPEGVQPSISDDHTVLVSLEPTPPEVLETTGPGRPLKRQGDPLEGDIGTTLVQEEEPKRTLRSSLAAMEPPAKRGRKK